MGKASDLAPVAVQAEPLKGQNYAQLQSSSDVPLALRCTQKLWLAPKLSAKLFAMFSQVDGKAEEPRIRLQVKHKVPGNLSWLDTRVSVRARYDHARHVAKGTVYLKKRVELGPHTAVNAKVELHQRVPIPPGDKVDLRADGEVQARLELSHVALNATSSQDFRVRVGLDVLNHVAYGEVRENRLTVKGDTRGQWSVVYDL
jgi:hypothetical protein